MLNGYMLATPAAVMDQAAAMQGPPFMQGMLQRIKHNPVCAAELTRQSTTRREKASIIKATCTKPYPFDTRNILKPGRITWRPGKYDQTNL